VDCSGKFKKFRRSSSVSIAATVALTLSTLSVPVGAADPVPYAPIAMPIKDSGVDQKVRDIATLKFGRVRVNQAGYRRVDDSLGMAKFYYVSRAIPPTTFTVYDTTAHAVAGTGTLVDKGFKSGSKMEIWASNWAGLTAGGDVRYKLTSNGQGTTITAAQTYEGTLPTDLQSGHYYRVIVGPDTSVAFLISNNIYGHVRDALLKFLGINRSGDGPSWFHAPSHQKDGYLAKPSAPGAYKGGWYDCGDHLKEPQTMGYALATLATLTATLPARDRDNYGLNHAKTIQTDGIPDILAEAHYGAQFFLKSWILNGKTTGPGLATTDSGKKVGMITGVGDFGKDHGWWGRPENQDAMSEAGRGGYNERALRSELGANTLGDVAAGLAILSKRYRIYDAKFADSALAAAKDMYAYAKAHRVVVSSPAYNGAGPDKVNGNLALAATALLWVTKDKSYLNDIAYDKTIGSHGETFIAKASWEGGWMVMSNPNLRKGGANTDWANRHAIALYAFYKLILSDKDSALAFGVRDEAERQNLITHTIAGVMDNLDGIGGASGVVIPLPQVDPNHGGGLAIRASANWWVMYTQQVWVWNRYQMGNAAELFFYYDITKDLEAGLAGPELSSKAWNRDQVRQLMVRQMDYQLGENPWDLSMIFGIGKKNWNHPHHRAANPEGRNTPGTAYGYHSPVGALYGSWNPETDNDANPNGMPDYNDYTHAEVCLDGSTTTLIPAMGLAADEPLNIPPHATVKVLAALDTVADIEVDLDKYGKVTLDYGTVRGAYTTTLKSDSAGVIFKFHLSGLTIGTQYFFDVKTVDLFGNDTVQDHWVNPLPDGTPYNFTTMNHLQGQAKITGVKVCNVTADSAEIMWYTPNGEYQSSICWGTVPPVGSVTGGTTTCAMDVDVSGHATKFHYVKIGNLKEKTTYYFKVASDGRDGAWDDNKGADYQFTTPVKMANFSVYAVQYKWGSMPALAINVINNEPRNYDSLSLRVYVRAKDTVYNADGTVATHTKSTSKGLVQVPMLFKDVFAARYDICQAYDGAGFNKPCGDPAWGSWGNVPGSTEIANWGTLNRGVQMLPPTKMADTYDPTTNTNVFYFDLPLGPTMMNQGSRIRFDVIFAKRSEYSKTLTQPQLDLINWVKSFVPSVPNYAVGDTGWYDVLDTALAQHPLGSNTNDWSWMPHSTANGDPVDFIGIPQVADQTAANAIIDNPSDNLPLDPYFTVYRKGQFVYGFSPSAIEQSQKKTYWGIRTVLDTPFNVPGTAITLDQNTSKLYVTGTADIYDLLTPAAKGIITDIWVNGVRLTPAELAAAAVKDASTGLWNLKIPVKLAVGGQSLDITIFGGGSQCADTATTCEGGCAFYDANYFVQFTKGLSTKSVLSLLAPGAVTYPVKTAPDSLALTLRINDKDQSKKGSLGATVLVTVSNPLRAYSKAFTLTESVDTGVFLSGALSLTAKTTALAATDVPFLRGDTIWFKYKDANDEEDSSVAFVYSEAAWPLPVKAAIFRACDGSLKIKATFDKAFTAAVPWSDAQVVALNLAGDSVGVQTVPAAQITKGAAAEISFPLTESVFGTWQNAKLTLPVADGRGGWVSNAVTVSDSIGPWVDSAKVVENVLGTAQDTAYVWTSEKVAGLSTSSFVVSRAGVSAPVTGVDSVRATDATGRAWTVFVKSGNIKAGDSLRLLSTSTVRDLAGNAPSDCPSMGRKVSLIGRAAPFSKAWLLDSDGDGQADLVKMVYRKVVAASDLPDSIEVTFGDFATVRTAPVSAAQAQDSTVSVSLPVPFGWGQTKGLAADGSGTISLWKSGTRSSASALSDSVGPVLVAAALRFARLGDQDTVGLQFSEPVGPSVGTSWLTHQAGADFGALTPISVTPSTWYYPVPAGTVVAGDSVKPLSTSRWVDLSSGRHAPVAHIWIPVVGGERAPFSGWYTDDDGDAAVDHVHIRFQKAGPKTRPSFTIDLPGTPKIVVDSGTWTLDASGFEASVAIGPLAKNVTAFGASANGVWKSMGIETAFPIYDSVAPVLVSATLSYAAGDSLPDTLKVRWSENLTGLTTVSPVVHGSRSDRKGIVGLSTPDADGLGASILVWADSMGFIRGDSAQLDGVGAGIRDVNGNVPGPGYGWVPVKFKPRPVRLAFTIKNMLVTPHDPASHEGPSLSLLVRARPEKGASDTSWQRLDGFPVVPQSEIVSLTFTVNRAMAGSAHIFDNSGAFATAIDMGEISKMDAAGTLPKDGSGMFQVQLAWDGRDKNGKNVAGGVYFMRLVLKDGGVDIGEPVRIVNKVYGFGIKRMK